MNTMLLPCNQAAESAILARAHGFGTIRRTMVEASLVFDRRQRRPGGRAISRPLLVGSMTLLGDLAVLS
jgi:hypothetical protein